MPRIFINGSPFETDERLSILEATARAGICVPTVCFDARLAAIGSCRICSVDVEGEIHPQIACRTEIREGMRIHTHSPAIEAFRHEMISWLAGRVTAESFASELGKELHALMRVYGIDPAHKGRRVIAPDLSHPYIRVDMAQCIGCFRCVKICEDLQGEFVWHALGRAADLQIVPDSGTTLRASSCVSCGACVDTCPTAALTDRGPQSADAIERWTRTTCAYCGVGCELEAGISDGRIVRVRPAKNAPVNKGHLCVKGRYAFGFTHSSDRQRRPLVRQGKTWLPVSWDDALARCAEEFQRILRAHGPDSIGVIGSARATNEENYLIQKFARVVLGTNNVDCCARVCHTPSAAALKAMLGAGASTNSFDDIEKARTIFVFGANPLENHPVVGARIRRQVLQHGARLIVADPRRTELASMATIHLAPRPGTNIALLNALAHTIVSENLIDPDFLAERVAGWDDFRNFIARWPAERAAEVCGVPAEDIRKAAQLYAREKPAMSFHGLGLTEHVQGTEGVMALINLALLSGNIGKPGTGINPLRGQNNVQGAAQMGCDPAILTGSVPLDERRSLFEGVWDAPIPRQRGFNLMAMIDEALAGRLKALWVVGYDILPTLADMNVTRRALKKLDFVVVQDLFLTDTAEAVGDLFLPAASAFEKDGTFMNAERRIQRVRKAVDAPGEARPDWRIVCDIAERMGHGTRFAYGAAEGIWNEIRQVWPEAAGISYARLEQGGLQWPCRSEDDPGVPILHGVEFARSKRATLQKIDYVPSPEQTSPEFPILLTTGRNLYQFNAGTMTMRTPNKKLRQTDVLEIAPADAGRLNIQSGRRVLVRSRYGHARMSALVTDRIKSGEAFATFHDSKVGLNRLTGPFRDAIVGSPEYKVTAVAIATVTVRTSSTQLRRK
ncbi:MAG: formate dehydrogenase subunit alpha [Proteobacteria bacterium]|nr:formate dehydrogenase subunit alpha [Pseudomonadota bacterium]